MNHEGGEANANSETNPLIVPENDADIQTSTLYIMSKIWVWIVSVFITFAVVLSVFPSITAIVESTEKGKVILVFVYY